MYADGQWLDKNVSYNNTQFESFQIEHHPIIEGTWISYGYSTWYLKQDSFDGDGFLHWIFLSSSLDQMRRDFIRNRRTSLLIKSEYRFKSRKPRL